MKLQLHLSMMGYCHIMNAKGNSLFRGEREDCVKFLTENNYEEIGKALDVLIYRLRGKKSEPTKARNYTRPVAAFLILQSVRDNFETLLAPVIHARCGIMPEKKNLQKIRDDYARIFEKYEMKLMKLVARHVNKLF